jgi:hypothetical protein
MKKNNDFKINSGMNLLEVLFLIFLVLKLTGLIQWSWVWVLSPLWIDIILMIIVAAIIAFVTVVSERENSNEKSNNKKGKRK